MKYTREDIYLCHCCGKFFDTSTDQQVNVSYDEMPAEFAINLMFLRQEIAMDEFRRKRDHRPKPKRRFRFEP